MYMMAHSRTDNDSDGDGDGTAILTVRVACVGI